MDAFHVSVGLAPRPPVDPPAVPAVPAVLAVRLTVGAAYNADTSALLTPDEARAIASLLTNAAASLTKEPTP